VAYADDASVCSALDDERKAVLSNSDAEGWRACVEMFAYRELLYALVCKSDARHFLTP
jgi:hypothetical protein